jgi:hypothetical protein
MVALATYMGHVNIYAAYWYLEATADLLSDHVLRHTCAMIVLQATQDIRKVSLWLGHASLASTEIYSRGDPTEKLEAIEAIVPPHLRKEAFRGCDDRDWTTPVPHGCARRAARRRSWRRPEQAGSPPAASAP